LSFKNKLIPGYHGYENSKTLIDACAQNDRQTQSEHQLLKLKILEKQAIHSSYSCLKLSC
jgi:hypothetical protein